MTIAESAHSWRPASDGPLVRGTVILLPGRGEHGGVYERFGRRLANDAYTVHALDTSPDDDLAALSRLVEEVAADASTPVVLAGSDTGALQALALVSAGAARVDGILLVGLPTSGPDAPIAVPVAVSTAGLAGPDGSEGREGTVWDHELAARTSCPAHRARLTADADFARGSLTAPIPSHLASVLHGAGIESVTVPALLLHGGADAVAPLDAARSVAVRLPHGELAVTADGRHDVLNDIMHRSVAAEVVQWLERLRGGPGLAPVISVEIRQTFAFAR